MHINDIPSRRDIAKIVARFESRFIPEPMSGCWLWFGACDARFYGKMNLGGGIYVKAHRLSFVLFKGPLSANACHHCDNPACVNPDHLFDGTRSENTLDSWRKGRRVHIRTPMGEANNKAKLTAPKVIEIRARLAQGDPVARIALEHGVTVQSIYYVRHGQTWKHLLPS